MLLVVDVGNTNITLGVYKEDKIIRSWRLSTTKDKSSDEIGLMLMGFFGHDNIDVKDIIGSTAYYVFIGARYKKIYWYRAYYSESRHLSRPCYKV